MPSFRLGIIPLLAHADEEMNERVSPLSCLFCAHQNVVEI